MPRVTVSELQSIIDRINRVTGTPRPYPWPFPVTLPAPGHAPESKPVRPPAPDTSTLPLAPF